MEGNGIQPVMNMDGNGSGFGSGFMGIFAIFAIIALLGGGFWGNRGGNGGGDNGASLAEAVNLSNGQQTAMLEAAANQRQNCSDFVSTNANITGGFSNLARDICTLGTSLASSIYGSTSDIKDRLANMSAQQAEGFCGIQRGIDSVNYNAAINTAAINANIDSKFAALEKSQLQAQLAAQQSEINQLRLQQAVTGVVRYPNGMTYNAGTSPFCNNSYCCG
jgi:multidrug efflux pump subunit AcrA (membrane-fusion protein)